MGTLKYIATVIFAVIFIGIGLTLYSQHQQGAAEQDFRFKAEDLAGQIEELGNQSENTTWYFEISVPSNCELRFTDNAVVIVIGGWSDNFPVGGAVSGPAFTNQRLTLKLERTESGVSVSEA